MRRIQSVGILLCALLFWGMAASLSAEQGISKSEIVLGSHTDLSGPAAIWGVAATNALRLYFDEINQKGGVHGRQIKLVVEDHQYQVPRAVQAANKLINRDKIFAMIAALGTPQNNAVLTQQMEKKIPNIFPYTAARSMVEPFDPLKFGGIATYYDQMRTGVKYFVEQKGKKSICIMYQDTDYGQEVVDGVTDQLNAMKMKVVETTSHKPTDTDFVAAITKLRKAECDLIVLGSIVKDTIISMGTARKMGWMVDFLGTIASFDQIIIDKGQGATEGYYAMSSYNMAYPDTASTPEAKAFFENYQKTYGQAPSAPAQIGFMAGKVFVEGLRNAGANLTVDSFIKGIESIQGLENTFGGTSFNFSATDHNPVKQTLLTQVQKERWVSLTAPMSY